MTIPSWQVANIPGPQIANVLEPELAATMIKKAKNPIILVGPGVSAKLGEKTLADIIIELSKGKKIPIIATADSLIEFAERKFDVYSMGLVEAADRLRDEDWSVNSRGGHDLVIFLGINYCFESQILSILKNFAPHLKTITLDRYFHPNADWSFQNLKYEEWEKHLYRILKILYK